MLGESIGVASFVVWLCLVFARGGFWRIRTSEAPPLEQAGAPPAVAVIVPARNEADVVGAAIRSLVGQSYPGPYHVFLVDDASTDGTADVARVAAKQAGREDRLTIVQAETPAADRKSVV